MKFRYVDKFQDWTHYRYYYGRKKGFYVEVKFSFPNFLNKETYWYFSIRNDKIDKTYNSLWNDKKYDDPNIAMKDAEEWVDNYLKDDKS